MNFDTLWDVDKYKSDHESEEHWLVRRAFLVEHKNKYPEDRLVSLAQTFFNVEFLGCRYPQQTMDLIENLSKGLVDDLREKRKGKLQRTFVVASDAAMEKAKGTRKRNAPNKNNNQSQIKKSKTTTPFHPEYILPGFMLILGNSEDPIEILDRSCSFCNMAQPLVKFDKRNSVSNSPIIKADLYINNKLIASGSGSTKKVARKEVSKIAYNKLKKICFIIQIKEHQDKENPINKINISNNLEQTNDCSPSISTTNEIIENDECQKKLSEDNIGNKLLKMMGWKEGVGLGKNSQGRLEPIEVIQLPKNMGLGNKNASIGSSAKQKIMFAFQREINKHIKEFMDSPKKKLTFSTEFTKEERKLIHVICLKFGLKTKSYGKNENRHIVIFKKENSQEVFEELINNGLENDYYKLIPPTN